MNSSASDICFGLNRQTDQNSLVLFLGKMGDERLLQTLVPRLEEAEILAVVDLFTGLMKKHLNKQEYHRLFLADGE